MKPPLHHARAQFDGMKTSGISENRSYVLASISRLGSNVTKKLPQFLFLTLLASTLALTAAAQTPSFQGLGQMPGGWPAAGTYASAISGDGSTIMGYGWVCFNGGTKCNTSGSVQAYRWTVAGGFQVLGNKGNSDFFGAGAVSSNGSVIVGEHPLPNNNSEVFRWTAAHGMAQLPMLIATAVTADGTMVAGGDSWWNSGKTGIFGPLPAIRIKPRRTDWREPGRLRSRWVLRSKVPT